MGRSSSCAGIWKIVMGSNNNLEEIEMVCAQIAKIICAPDDGTHTDEKIITENLKRYALEQQLRLKNGGSDPNVVLRALKYTGYTHAFPRAPASIEIYITILDVLIEVACPSIKQDAEIGGAFLDDLLIGVQQSKR